MTWTLISPARRTSSWTTEPCSISNQRERSDLPITIWVMLLACGVADDVVGDAAAGNGDGLAAQPLGEAQRVGDAVALGLAEALMARRSRHRSPSTARAAGRRGAGIADEAGAVGCSLTQTSTRSPAAHGPLIACARI